MKKEIVTDRSPASSPRRLFATRLRRLRGVMSVAAPSALLCLTLLALATVPTQAQSFTGSISGMITDPNGAVIQNATVTLTAADTGLTRTTTTNHAGEYNFPSLPPGQYKIRVTAANFNAGEINARLAVAQQLRADAQLKVGVETETVNITAGEGEVSLDKQNAELSTLLTGRQIVGLPLITRNPYDLIALSGGATDGPDRGSGNQRGAGFAVNGQRSQSANFMLDGGENNDTFTSMPGQSVPLDAIQEFRVQTSDFTAEFGRGSGYVANVVTKSGSNSFHGSAYEFNRNSALAANDSFSNANGFPKEFFNRNQFGFSAGGPVIEDKTFFFGSAEWLKVRSSVNTGFFVPTPQFLALTSAATQSIFSQFAAPTITGRTATAASLGFNNLVDAGGNPIDPSTPLFGRVTTTVPRDAGAGSPQNTALWTLRLDHNFSDRTSLFGRYAYDREEALTGSNSFSPYQGFNTSSKNRNQNLTLQLTHTWSPSVVTESRFVYNRLLNEQPLGSAPVSPTFLISDVISRQTDGDTVLPGYFATASTLGNAIPFGGPQNLYQGYSSLNYQRGAHELKFGAQYLHIRDNRTFGAFQNAIADFVTLQDFINANVQDYEIAVDPHGQLPGQALNAPFTAPSFTRHFRYNEVALFGEDTWKLSPRLTVSAGLRWEYFGVLHSPGNEKRLDANFYPGTGGNFLQQIAGGQFSLTTAQIGDLQDSFYRPDYNNFAPRLGVAYDLFGHGKTVLRAGYGIYYDRNFGNVLFNVIQNPPNYAVLFAGTGNNPAAPIIANVDQYAALAALSGQSYSSSARALDPNLRTAYANAWNANIQHDLGEVMVLTIGYAGSNGIKLYSLDNINRRGSGVLLGVAGRLNPTITNINFRSNAGSSNYNSLQLRADSRYIKRAGLQFTAAYTWAHAIDNESSTFGDSYLLSRVGGGVFGFQDAFNPAGDRGNADFDVRHRLVTSFNWDIPFARDLRPGWMKAALNGWAMNGIVSFRTGVPFTIFDTGQADNGGQTVPVRPIINGAAPVVGALTPVAGVGGTFNYLDLSAFSSAPSVNGPFVGTIGRNTFRAPGLQTWNLSFLRDINLTESKKLQFRAEMYNPFNHPNLFVAGGTNNIANNATNTVEATRGGLFDNINNVEQHRNVQLALKFIF
ncbi:MAG TPA: carboxypeptidase regulatory-like domain-containing protein [Blastocatellia bacterium]|nr:carboxypeptidase regulatory-like domain-containing protein [Blastocatellia bacterium]